jgi:hypothetical protein
MSFLLRSNQYLGGLAWFNVPANGSTWVYRLVRDRSLKRPGTWTVFWCLAGQRPGPVKWISKTFVERSENTALKRFMDRVEVAADAFQVPFDSLQIGMDGDLVLDHLVKAGRFNSLPGFLKAAASN